MRINTRIEQHERICNQFMLCCSTRIMQTYLNQTSRRNWISIDITEEWRLPPDYSNPKKKLNKCLKDKTIIQKSNISLESSTHMESKVYRKIEKRSLLISFFFSNLIAKAILCLNRLPELEYLLIE